jgi:3'-phosphoadenosine 5'-phosphosulfate sulfotransferase (PAPS reductase)/FAD synthetase
MAERIFNLSGETLEIPRLVIPPSHVDVAELSRELAEISIPERVVLAEEVFAGRTALLSSFGKYAPVTLKQVTDVVPNIRVATIETGHENPRTLEIRDQYARDMEFELKIEKAKILPLPIDDEGEEFEEFKRQLKQVPLDRHITNLGLAAYYSGVMGWQNETRKNLPFAQLKKNGAIAIHPILDLSKEEADEYREAHNLVFDPNYFDVTKGFNPDGDSYQNQECGINGPDS